jgi:hypothetical protein
MNLIEHITEWIYLDDECTEKQSNFLTQIYKDANENEKAVIDEVLICICGYSLKTLLKDK